MIGTSGNWLYFSRAYQFDDDWYRIRVTDSAYRRIYIQCNFTDSQGDIDIKLYDLSGNVLASSTSSTDNETIDFTVSGVADYYIKAYYDNNGNYYNIYWDALYTGEPPPLTISGYVKTSSGSGISGVTVTFSNSGGTDTTDSNGYYSEAVPYGWSGTATPSKSGYTFSPTFKSYSNVISDDSNENYTGTATTPTISGYIKTSGGSAISGVTVTFSNSGGTDTTDSNGYYNEAVPYDWSGTATPSKSGYTFSPTSKSYFNVTFNDSSENYTEIPFTADFDLDYIYQTPLHATEFTASSHTVYPTWWLGLGTDSTISIGSIEFQAPYPFTNTFPESNDVTGTTYRWDDIVIEPGSEEFDFEIDAEQSTVSESVYFPYTVTRSFTGNNITGVGDITTTVTVIPGLNTDSLDVEITLFAAQNEEAWDNGNFFGTLSHVSNSQSDSNYYDLEHTDENDIQEYEWEYRPSVPEQVYIFSCTVHVELKNGIEQALIEPRVEVSGSISSDSGTENWTGNTLALDPAGPHAGGVVTVNSSNLIK